MSNDSKPSSPPPQSIRPPARGHVRIEGLAAALEQPLEDEAAILDALAGALGKGHPHPELWVKLHEAAAKCERIADLAFAYERLLGERRIKLLSSAAQAELLMHAATFFADVFGDLEGASGFLEKVLALAPGHADAFAKLESLLAAGDDMLKLADLYSAAAPHRPDRGEQLDLLRRASELVDTFTGEQERAIKLQQQILKLDPGDAAARGSLEARYRQAGRHADAAKLLEQALSAQPPPDEDAALEIRSRLMSLYAGDLGEPERAMPHVEEVLRADPVHDEARQVAERLLTHKPVAARAAAALAGVYERLHDPAKAAAMLALELDGVRGPKRLEVQKRLAVLRYDELGELPQAWGLLDAIVAIDPGDPEIRRRYREASAKLDRRADAARVLARAAASAKDPKLRARLGLDVGEIFVEAKDDKRARVAFQGVLDAGGDDEAVRLAARALATLLDAAADHKALASVLEALARVEDGDLARYAAAEKLAALAAGPLADPARAAAAWRLLLDTPREAKALAALEPLYEAAGAAAELVEVLDRRAAAAKDDAAAADYARRAAVLRSTKLGDRAAALGAWKAWTARWGESSEARTHMMPLLEHEKRWDELAALVAEEANATADAPARIALLSRLSQLRRERLKDPAGALDAYRQILALDRSDKASRTAVEKLLVAGDLRLSAADLLEPIYREEGAFAGLARLLDTRAELASDVVVRLAALGEQAALLETELRDPRRALEVASRGLAAAIFGAEGQVPAWIERLERLSAGLDPAKKADALAAALGDREVTGPVLLDLARRAGEALVACGDVTRALGAYRRALAFDPSSAELLARVDALLREQGSPGERIALYRSALEQPCEAARRKELLYAIGSIQRKELGDLEGAIATFQTALSNDASDEAAFEALLEAYGASGAWDSVYAELEREHGRAEGDRRSALLTRMAEVSAAHGEPSRALGHYRAMVQGGQAGEAVLDAAEKLAESLGDAEAVREILERRVAMAIEPVEEATWLERLGEVLASKVGDVLAAAEVWKRAASVAVGPAGDDERAVRLCERVLAAKPDDRDTAARLVELYVRAEAYAKVPAVYAVLLASPNDGKEAVELALAFEPHAVRAGAVDALVAAIDDVLARVPEAGARAPELLGAQARALAAVGDRADDAARAHRRAVEASGSGAGPAVDAFEAFLSVAAAVPARTEDRRWLFAWRAEHAEDDAARTRVLVAWAQAEEAAFGDRSAAIGVQRRLLALDPDRTESLAAVARLLLEVGETEQAIEAMRALAERSDAASRAATELEIAGLLLEKLGRPDEALDAVTAVLDATPTDAAALAIAERALAWPASRARAAALLERACDASDDAERATEILNLLLATAADATDVRASRRGWFERLLGRAEGRPEDAFSIALRAVGELPEEEALWDRAEKLAVTTQQPGPLGAAYVRALEGALDAEVAAAVGQRAALFHEEWFEEPETIVSILRRTLALAPSASWAFDRLRLAYDSGERWGELFELYDGAIARASEASERARLLDEAAQAAKDFAGDPDRAIAYLEQLVALRPSDARIVSWLERLYERQHRSRPLIDLLSRQLPQLAGEARARMLIRLAGLWLDLRDEKSAFDVVSQILADDEGRAEAVDLLEKLLALGAPSIPGMSRPPASDAPTSKRSGKKKGAAAPPAPVRQRAAALLKARYEAAGDKAALVRMLEVELEAIASPKERVRRYREIVSLRLEGLGDRAGAFACVAALVDLEPSSEEHRALFATLAEQTGQVVRRAELLVEVGERCGDPSLRVQMLAEAAAIFRDRAADPERAIALLSRVTELSGKDTAAALAAARDLDPLLAAAGRADERCRTLERMAELETDPARRREALGKVAEIAARELADEERAVRAWGARLEDDRSDLEALSGLAAAYERTERWPELVETLDRRATVEPAPEDKRRDRARIARLFAGELGAPAQAIDTWMRVREQLGADAESFAALSELLEGASRWDDLCSLFEGEAGSAADARGVALLVRAGELHRDRTGRPDRAVADFAAALAAAPDDAAAQAGMRALLGHAEVRALAIDALASAHAATADWSAAADLAATLGRDEDVPSQVARAIWWNVGVLLRERGVPGPAEAALARALAHDPASEEILAGLAGLRRASPSQALVDTLLRLSDVRGGEVELLREAATVALRALGDRAQASAIGERLLEVAVARWNGAEDAAAAAPFVDAAGWAIDELSRISLEQGEHRKVADLLLGGARLPFDLASTRSLRQRAAALLSERLGDPNAAIAIYRELFAESATDEIARASVTRFAELLEAEGRFADQAELWETQALARAEAGETDAAARLFARAAAIAEEKLDDVPRAIASHARAADLGSRDALEGLARLHAARGDHAAAATALERLLAPAPRESQADIVLRLAEAYVAAGDRDSARSRLEEVAGRALDPTGIRARLAELYREDGAFAKLAELVAEQAAHAPDRATRLAKLREAAELHLAERGDPSAAVPLLEQAVEIDPDDSAIRLRLADALSAAGRHDAAAAILRAQVERYGTRRPKERALVHFQLAQVALAAGDRARALGELDLAAKIDQAHPEILHTLATLALEEGQLERAQRTYRALLMILRRPEGDVRSGPTRAEVLLDLSEIATRQGEPERASEFLESAFEASRESAVEAARFEDALRRRGKLDVLARVLGERLATALEPTDAARVLADLLAAGGALDGRVRAKADEVLRALEKLGTPDDEAWAALESVYGKLGEVELTARVLERRIEWGTKSAVADPLYRLAKIRLASRATLLDGVGLLERALALEVDPARAEDALAPALELAFDDPRVLRLFERIARAPGRERQLATALSRLASVAEDPAPLLREATEIARGLGDRSLAETILRDAVDKPLPLSPGDRAWALVVLAELSAEAGDLAAAANLKEQAAVDAPPEEARRLLLEVGALARGPLDDLARAARIYGAMFEREPADREAWEPLLEVYRRLGDGGRLVSLIQATVPLVDSVEERCQLRLEQANVMLADPSAEAAAAGLLRDILEEDPKQLEAAILLSGMLERAGKLEDLASLLATQLDLAKDREESASVVSLSIRLGALLEQQDRAADALEVYQAALDWNASSREMLSAIVRLCEARGDAYELADAIEKLLGVESGEAAAGLAIRLAALRRDQGDEQAAERAVDVGFAACPASAELRDELVRRHGERGDAGAVAAVLRRGYDAAPGDRQVFRSLLAAYRRTGDHAAAIDVVTRALEAAPSDVRLLHERASLHEAQGDDEASLADLERIHAESGGAHADDLIAALDRAIERAGAAGDRKLKLRLAELLAQTGVPGSARSHLADLLKRDAKDRDALRLIARLEDADARWDAASATYRRLLPLEEGSALVEVALSLARACEQAGRFADARAGLERALRVDPGNADVRRRLFELYGATGQHRELAGLLLEEAAAEADVTGRTKLLLRAGELLLSPEGDPLQALSVLEQARGLRPEDDEGAVLLSRAYATLARPDEAIALLDQAAAAHKGRRSKQLSSLLREKARVELAGGDLTSGLESMTKAFEMDLHNSDLAMELGRLAHDLDEAEISARAFRSVTLMKSIPPGAPVGADGASGESRAIAYYYLALQSHAAGDLRKAKLMAEKAVSEDPTLEHARTLLEGLKSGQL